jgi:hypothetical protein
MERETIVDRDEVCYSQIANLAPHPSPPAKTSLRRLYGASPKSVWLLYGPTDKSDGVRVGPKQAGPWRSAAQWFARITHMLDLVFVIVGAALFLGALIYARLCANI